MADSINIPFKVSMQGNAQAVFAQISQGFTKIAKGLQKAAKAQLDLQNTDVASSIGHVALEVNKYAASLLKGSKSTQNFTKDMKTLVTEFNDIAKGSSDFAKKTKLIFQAVADGRMPIENARKHLKNLQDQFHRFRVAGRDVDAVKDRWEKLTAGVQKGSSEWKDAEKKTKDLGLALGDIANKLKLANVSSKGWAASVKETNVANAQAKHHLDLVSGSFRNITEEGYKFLGLNKAQAKAINKANLAQNEYFKSLDRAEKMIAKGIRSGHAYKEAVENIGKVYGRNDEVFKRHAKGIEASHKSMIAFKDTLSRTHPELVKYTKNIDFTAVALGVIDNKIKTTKNGFQVLTKQGLEPFGVKSLDVAKKLGLLHSSFGRMEEQQKKYLAISNLTASSVEKTTKKMLNQGKTFDQIARHYRQLSTEMRNAGNSATTFANSIQMIGRSMKTYARYMISSTVLRGLTEQFNQGVISIIEYDQALHDLKAIMQATDTEVTIMSKALIRVAQDTKFSMGEVGEAMRKLGQAGFTAQEATVAIGGIANLATGTLESLEKTVNLVSTAVRVFGMSMADTTEVADIFANAVNKSRLTIDKLNTSFNYIGPLAAAAGLDLKDTAASMMLLANAGVRASTIGTGFRRILGGLLKPTGKFKQSIYNAGYTIADFNPEFNDFSDIIERLPEVVTNASDALQMFGYRGSSVISAFAQQGVSEFDRLKSTLDNNGTAMRMAEEQMRGLAVQMKNIKDKAGVLAKTLGEGGFTAILRGVVFITRRFLDALITIAGSPLGKFIIGVTVATTAMLALGTAISGLFAMGIVPNVMSWAAGFVIWTGTLVGATTATVTATGATIGLGSALVRLKVAALALIATPFGATLATIGVIASGVALAFYSYSKRLKESIIRNEEFSSSLATTLDKFDKYNKIVKKHGKDSSQARNQAKSLRKSVDTLGKTWTDVKGIADEFTGSVDENTGAITGNDTAVQNLEKTLREKYVKALARAYVLDAKRNNTLSAKMKLTKDLAKVTKELAEKEKEMIRGAGEQGGGVGEFWLKMTTRLGLFNNGLEDIEKQYKLLEDQQKAGHKAAMDRWTSLKSNTKEIIDSIVEQGTTREEISKMDEAAIEKLIKSQDVFIHSSRVGYLMLKKDLMELKTTYNKAEDAAQKFKLEQAALQEHFAKFDLDISGGITAEFKTLHKSFEEAAYKGKGTANEIIKAFKKLGGEVKNVSDLQAYREALKRLEEQGKLSANEILLLKKAVEGIGESLDTEATKIMEVTESKLRQLGIKAAEKDLKTKQAFADSTNKYSLAAQNKFNRQVLLNEIDRSKKELKIREDEFKALQGIGLKRKKESATVKQLEDAALKVTEARLKLIAQEQELQEQKRDVTHAAQVSALKKSFLAIEKIHAEEASRLKRREAEGWDIREGTLKNDLVMAKAKENALQSHLKNLSISDQKYRDTQLKKIHQQNLKIKDLKTEQYVLMKEKADEGVDEEMERTKNLHKIELKKLKDQHAAGIINGTEYNRKKQELLDKYILAVELYYAKLQALHTEGSDVEIKIAKQKQDALKEIEADIEKARLDKEGIADAKKAETIYKAQEAETLKAETAEDVLSPEEIHQREMDLLQQQHNAKVDAAWKLTKDIFAIEALQEMQRREREARNAKFDEDMRKKKLSDTVKAANGVAGILDNLYKAGIIRSKKAFKAMKAISIATTMISTFESAQEAYKAATKGEKGMLATVKGAIAAAVAMTEGMARVAAIRKEVPSYAEGGLVRGPGGPKDDKIDAKLSNKEFVEPAKAVSHYGAWVFEGLRNLSFPKEMFTGYKKNSATIQTAYALADGGFAKPSKGGDTFTFEMTNTFTGDIDESNRRQIGDDFEDRVKDVFYRMVK